ncbi:TetR/AcrR family transcriptional regulator [Bacillus sp. EB106-08-02-XG196]|jgi:AcrR family transcriptional regulator|uniref:TetR/AcrR family transcriptional regulator n=1 Tax=Bacillus sp. EB106-08-02-XG196 TaxID=2737049 RepID=UPI0015C48C8E|nr:TetR/AcrR family transcriptional regulator [Bacillus sp. EB106-08-02-XG196]NWQ42332.1 TetR/AcrR family transcriptional regulator [Bacillus sp. EB106-08-02-XG196]
MKKQLIMEKAIELFAKQGFEATSVQQITEHCGISKGAFYLSFKSKDELIIEIIDHFMIQFTSEIDYLVRNAKDGENLLYKFYYAIFNSFQKHSDFGKILIKEQSRSFNEDFIVKMRYYDRLMDKTILSMVECLYGDDEVKEIKYDLVFCIKGFMSMYSQLFLFYNVPLDLDLLSKSLVEKTNLLARNSTIPFISKGLINVMEEPTLENFTKEKILLLMDQEIKEMEESIEKESLVLLKQQLHEPTFGRAIVKGLLKNIRNHPQTKWISYLLGSFFDM